LSFKISCPLEFGIRPIEASTIIEGKMKEGFNKRKPTNTMGIHWHTPVVGIFIGHN